MMTEEWPMLWVLLATYRRTTATLRTIEMIKQHLKYPRYHVHICDDNSGKTDDGTDRWHVGVLAEAVSEFCPDVTWHETDTPPGAFNTGKNINMGIRTAMENGCNQYLLDFDDWALRRDLDLRPMVDVLDTYQEVGFIRLSYWVPWLYSVTQRYDSARLNTNYIWQRLLRAKSRPSAWPSDHYLVSTQPYVAHTRFHDAYGWHPENCNPGQAETGLGNQYNDSPLGEEGPQILFPVGEISVHGYYDHLVGRAHYYANV